MKKLDFQPAKSKDDFRKNYKLHDLAEYHGKNLLTQWGIEFRDFGKDNRYEKVWEKGKDKPDVIAEYNEQEFLIDWKGKTKETYWVNKRAIDSYINWSKKLNMQMVVCFFLFDKNFYLKDRKFALLNKHNYQIISNKAWDKNEVVKFSNNIPKFTKFNLVELISR